MEISQVQPGATVDEIAEALRKHDNASPFFLADPGGITALGPGERLRYQRRLPAGTYALFCSLPTSDGSDHISKGMIRLVKVSASQPGNPPEPRLTLALGDSAMTVPALTAGTHRVTVVNNGTEPHEIWITGVPKSADQTRTGDVDTWVEHGQAGPPPLGAHFPGGHQSITPGTSVELTMHFRSGYTYHFTDNASGSQTAQIATVT